MIWQEKADGYFFPRENLSAAVRAKLQILSLENSAQIYISSEEPLLTVQKIQAQSATAAAKTDQYISEKKIIVPDKLSVDFKESGDAVEVQPILLENRGDELKPIACADFLETFSKRKKVLSTYKGKDGAQYVFSATLRDVLTQIKNVGTISKADARRYILQPKELFTGEAFDFNYSDRVIGVEEMTIGGGYFGGTKIDWGEGGTSEEIPAPEGKP